MFKKIKDILGIEGVKIDIFIPEEVKADHGSVSGQIVFSSQTAQQIEKLVVKLVEKYRRGRNDAKLINEYLLGSIEIELELSIEANEEKKVDFELPFNMMLSEMDQLAHKNIFLRSIVKLAKSLKNVKSEFKIEAMAYIKGTKLHPSVSKPIELIK